MWPIKALINAASVLRLVYCVERDWWCRVEREREDRRPYVSAALVDLCVRV
jgi:hypothetical protein